MKENLEEFVPIMDQVFKQGGVFRLYPRGESMLPFLRPGRDSVVLAPPGSKIPRGTTLLFRRTSGAFVLHRVVGQDDRGFHCVGDHQLAVERGIGQEQIIAAVVGVYRDEMPVNLDGPGYGCYCRLWRWSGVRWLYMAGGRVRQWIKRR